MLLSHCFIMVVETRKMDGGHSSMRPKSPDFHGKRKQMVKIQCLEREISLLQEELKSLEGLHPASRCCKELDAFVGSVSDPFTPTRKQSISKSHHHFRKQIRVRCSHSCQLHKKMAKGYWACCFCSSNSKCCHCCARSCLKSASRSCAQNCC